MCHLRVSFESRLQVCRVLPTAVMRAQGSFVHANVSRAQTRSFGIRNVDNANAHATAKLVAPKLTPFRRGHWHFRRLKHICQRWGLCLASLA